MNHPNDDLRQNIRKLAPDGQRGFEGLIAAVLSELTGRSFVLASAGSQHGRDGQSVHDDGEIVFEAKRYDDAVPKDKLYTKLVEIAADKASRIELFVVGATCAMSLQHINTLNEAARKLGVAVLIIAWPETALADLAVLLAMAPEISATFIAQNGGVDEAELRAQLTAVAAHTQFGARVASLRRELEQPSVAPPFALQNNRHWLGEAFADAKRARSVFAQALSPADPAIPSVIDRPALRTMVAQHVFHASDGVIVALLGADGNGKSWIFAQAWRQQAEPPLTLVILPEDVPTAATPDACRELLIGKLLMQSGESVTPDGHDRWLRHFARWRTAPTPSMPRMVVLVDGLNQRASIDWPRFLDALSDLITQLGGRLVFSSRQMFYRDRLEDRLISAVIPIDVPEWSDPEVDELLRPFGASVASLEPAVVRSLRNPRIFGVAAKLFSTHEITTFGELSVSRLLFEHIRSGSATSGSIATPSQFAAEICTHAEEIVHRLKQPNEMGVNEFDLSHLATEAGHQVGIDPFAIVAAGRFFEVLDENPNKYLLRDDCVPLALGLALVRTAQNAARRGASVETALATVLDPIAALDRTSDILLGAIIAAVIQKLEDTITAPLVSAAVQLQNLGAARYAEFCNLFVRAPSAFLVALEACACSSSATANLSWLTGALFQLRGAERLEAVLLPKIHQWLSVYSLAPERMQLVPNTPDQAAERQEKRSERVRKLAQHVDALSEPEKTLLESLPRQDAGDYSVLNALALKALAGRALAPFAASFRNWCFANALNGGYQDESKAFDALLHFNVVDWADTRAALREEALILRQSGTSATGRWALVELLRVSGESADAKEAEDIADELTKDQRAFGRWRLLENYCATDPCDPASTKPDNIEATAAEYRTLDPAQLRFALGMSQQDHFFEMAKAGLARFSPDASLHTLRAFAEQALTRPLEDFRFATFQINPQTVGLTPSLAPHYVQKARELTEAALEQGEDRERKAWIASQYALCIAFPHLSAEEQFQALVNRARDETVLMDLIHLCRPIDGQRLEKALACAVESGDEVAQFRVLSFADFSRTPLTPGAKALLLDVMASSHSHVRLSLLSLIQHTQDRELLAGLVASGWTAANVDPVSAKIEAFHGSHALVAATREGLISIEGCLERIAPSAFEAFAKEIGHEAAVAIASRLTVAIFKAAAFEVQENLPDIKYNLEGRFSPLVYEVSDRPAEAALADPTSGGHDTFYERQRRNQASARRFEEELNHAGAQLILEAVTPSLIAAIEAAAPQELDAWCAVFLAANVNSLNNLHNLAYLVTGKVARRSPAMALQLFERLESSTPRVRLTFGPSELGLESVTIWEAADSPEIKALRVARLDHAANDHTLSLEVLAAIRAGCVQELRDYVLDRRARPEPSHRARAAMVAGLSPEEAWALETVELFSQERGFLQNAYRAAKYAMERHQWSRHWAAMMREAENPEDLWRYAILHAKIVDGRFSASEIEGITPKPLIQRFSSTLNGPIRQRLRRWKSKREDKLFGMPAPESVFLPVPGQIKNEATRRTPDTPTA